MSNQDNAFFSPGASMSVRARRALFESGTSRGTEVFKTNPKSPPTSPGRLSPKRFSPKRLSPSRLMRKPLAFLSPNFIKRGNEEDDVDKLKNEVSELQKRITNLDAEGRHELLDMITEKDSECEQKEEHLQRLNKKLLLIQTGLQEIEGERTQLVTKAKQLETEKTNLQEQLEKSEKEIQTLSKRCANNAVRTTKETVTDRSMNKELSQMVVDLKAELDERNHADSRINDLNHKLRLSQQARDDLSKRLQDVQRDHEAVCQNLVKCLQNVDKLTTEKAAWEKERRHLKHNWERQIEQQRMDHVQSTMDLKEDLKSREKKVNDLDRLLQDKIMSIQRLRNQLATSEASQAATLKKVADEYERKLLDLSQSYEGEMSDLQSKLSEKSAEIESLRNDMSSQMQELMSATSELQKLQEDSKMLDSLIVDVESLNHECFTLREMLHDKDTAIAELEAEILKHEIEKELVGQDTETLQELKEKVASAEGEKVLREKLKVQLQQAETKCQRLEEQIQQLSRSSKEKTVHIRSEYDNAIATMETKIRDLEGAAEKDVTIHKQAVAAKEKAITALELQIQKLRAELLANKESHQSAVSSLQEDALRATIALGLKEDEMRDLSVTEMSKKDETISSLRKDIARLSAESQASSMKAATKITSLEGQVNLLRAKSSDLENRGTERAREYQMEVEKMTETISELQQRNETAQLTVLDQARRLDATESKRLRSEAKATRTVAELQDQIRQLTGASNELENHIAELSREHQLEVDTMLQTIADLKAMNKSTKSSVVQHNKLLQESDAKMKEKESVFASEIAHLEQQVKELKLRAADQESNSQILVQEHQASVQKMEDTITELNGYVECLQSTNAEQLKLLDQASSKNKQNENEDRDKVTDLREQIVRLQSKTTMLESQSVERSQEYQKAIGKMTQTIDDLKREKVYSEITISDIERKLRESAAEKASLSKKLHSLESDKLSLENHCNMLRSASEETKSERDKLLVALESELSRAESSELGKGEALQGELAAAEKKLLAQEEQMAALEVALQDRTKLLSEMVDHNKRLEAKVEIGDTHYGKMEEKSSVLQVQLMDKKDELERLRSQWQLKEDEYLDEIHSERNLREICEADLANARSRLESIRVESKDLSELEKLNQELKDKVRRQEAYLKRKIEQEKAIRERILPGSVVKAQGNPMKTPARSGRGPQRKSASAHASKATRSTMPSECDTLDHELDSLLAD